MLTDLEKTVLESAPIKGFYVLGLGACAGRWTYDLNGKSVTRQVNRLIKRGLMATDAVTPGVAGYHPPCFSATALSIEST